MGLSPPTRGSHAAELRGLSNAGVIHITTITTTSYGISVVLRYSYDIAKADPSTGAA